jgi:hypothetical protein
MASLPGPMHLVIGVLRPVVAQGRSPVEVEQWGEQVGSMLPTEEGTASTYLMASQCDAVRIAGLESLNSSVIASPTASASRKNASVQSVVPRCLAVQLGADISIRRCRRRCALFRSECGSAFLLR